MFANDLLQSQLSLGAYSGAMSPFNSPWAASLQTAINPTSVNPFAGVAQTWGISPFTQPAFTQQGYGAVPNYAAIAQQQQQIQQQLQQLQLQHLQQLQALASMLSAQGANPQVFGVSQPNVLQNPLIAASLQNPLVNPILAQQLAMQQNPFAQSGFPLAPQSWVGQQIPGQIYPHHLQQLAGRGIY